MCFLELALGDCSTPPTSTGLSCQPWRYLDRWCWMGRGLGAVANVLVDYIFYVLPTYNTISWGLFSMVAFN